jgi:hypothetical protein
MPHRKISELVGDPPPDGGAESAQEPSSTPGPPDDTRGAGKSRQRTPRSRTAASTPGDALAGSPNGSAPPPPAQPVPSANAARRELDAASRALRALADKLAERTADWHVAVTRSRLAGVPEYELAAAAARAGMDLPDPAGEPAKGSP